MHSHSQKDNVSPKEGLGEIPVVSSVVYWVAFYAQKIFYETYLSLRSYHRERIPRRGGYIIASNHLSNLDPMLLAVAADRHLNFIAKSSLFKSFSSSLFLHQVGAFPLRRGAFDAQAIKEALKRLAKGRGIVMFPQGTRRESVDAGEAKAGVGFLAAKGNVPIVPACIFNSDKAMSPGAKGIRRAKVTIVFGYPITIDPNLSYQQIADQALIAIRTLASDYTSLADSR